MHALVHMDSDTSVPIHMHGHTTNTRKTGKKKKRKHEVCRIISVGVRKGRKVG